MSMDAKCWECGADIVKSFGVMDIQSGRYCLDCCRSHTKQYKETVAEYLRLKNKVMFERAMRTMERAYVDMTKYKRYAKAVEKHSAEFPDLYKSSDEIVAAVIMLETGIDFEMNFKVGQFIADMYIKEWKLIVEIDGELHEGQELKDSNRDMKIRQLLGAEWEIIRIPTKYIEQDPVNIPEAVQALAKQKRKLRKENGGFLPNSYSKREAAHYQKAMIYQTKRVPT